MTKQRWEAIKNLKEIPMDVWFEYYIENGGKVNNLLVFTHLFTRILFADDLVRNSTGRLVDVNFKTALNRLYSYYNDKFERESG